MFRETMAIRTSQMMTSRSFICLLENQNEGKLQKHIFLIFLNETTGGIVIGVRGGQI
jgi:hypothetical protein